jgi:DNA replication protein DnaC
MDDTALQTPRRARHVSDPKPLAEAFPLVPEHRRVDKRVRCAGDGCRRRVRVRTPERAPELVVTIVHRQLRGELPVFCEPCEEAIEERERKAEYVEQRQTVLAGRLRAADIPAKWAEATWEGVERDAEREAGIRAAERWSQAQGSRGVLLHGAVGRGKSHIAAVAAIERCRVSPVKWLNMAALVFAMSRGMGDPKRTAAMDVLEPDRYGAGVALVLDDLDKTRATEFGVQVVYLAVNAWIEAGQPLLVTMNYDLDELADSFGERFGDAIASRLAGYCQVFEIGGPDRRLA